jgi:outer membrane lipase/esterase
MMLRLKSKLVVLAFSVVCASQAAAATFDAMYVFGDSTVDSGWWSGALSGNCGAVAAPCTTGSSSKDALISNAIANGGTGAPVGVGLMNSQILASDFGLTLKPANQPGGTNYAISGALSAVTAGFGNLNLNANLPSTVGQITTYLGQHVNIADPSALYLISSGGNDITYAKNNFGGVLADEKTYLSQQAASLASAIHNIQLAGAQHILVLGNPGSGTLGTFWTSTLFSDLSGLGANFIGADIAGMVAAVEANPTLYGFTATSVLPGVVGAATGSACATETGAGASTSGWGQWCANKTTASSLYASLTSANAEQTSFYSDNEHFSAAGQLIEANYESSLLTPLPAALPLFASGLGALGLLGWRRKRKAAALAAA